MWPEGFTLSDLNDHLTEAGISAIKIDGFDKATLGYTDLGKGHALVYSYWRCLQVLMELNDWSYDEAIEYFEFNVMGGLQSYEGLPAPIMVHDMDWP
jgi:hypothetical protein